MSSFDELYDLVMESEEINEDKSITGDIESAKTINIYVGSNNSQSESSKQIEKADEKVEEVIEEVEKSNKFLKTKNFNEGLNSCMANINKTIILAKKYVNTKTIQIKANLLKRKAEKIKKDYKNGKISLVSACKELIKINLTIIKLNKEIKKELRKAKSLVKESADDIRLAIYESAYEGDISEEERDILLDMLDE